MARNAPVRCSGMFLSRLVKTFKGNATALFSAAASLFQIAKWSFFTSYALFSCSLYPIPDSKSNKWPIRLSLPIINHRWATKCYFNGNRSWEDATMTTHDLERQIEQLERAFEAAPPDERMRLASKFQQIAGRLDTNVEPMPRTRRRFQTSYEQDTSVDFFDNMPV
ncbi:hypothetical protein [Sulfitobacter geojensis]|nr:hypothetical protein [Sulfitobacter geojensis]